MFKKLLAAAAALAASTPAAFAGPYLNWETNLSYTGSDYNSALHELHIGWEGENGAASYYIQGGPAIVAPDGADAETEFSGKVGVGLPVSDALGAYGEVSFITIDGEDDLALGGKLGLKYTF